MRESWLLQCSNQWVHGDTRINCFKKLKLLYCFESWPNTPSLRGVGLGHGCHRHQVSTWEMPCEWEGFLAVAGWTQLKSHLWVLLFWGSNSYHPPPGFSWGWRHKITLLFFVSFCSHKHTSDTTEDDWINLVLEVKRKISICGVRVGPDE